MKLLFTLAHGYLPQGHGGLQKTIDQLSRELIKNGHQISVLASLMPGGRFGFYSRIRLAINRILFGRSLSKDFGVGYTVWRTWFPWGNPKITFPDMEIKYVIKREKPDLVIVASGESVRIAMSVQETGVPILMFLVDVEFQDHSGPFKVLGDVACIANSNFTADKHRSAFGINPTVIYPLLVTEEYRTQTTRENVTFINPSPHKGLDISLEIARLCPEIPFVFNECWPFSKQSRLEFMRKLRNISNVTLLPPQNDMRKVYGKCKILLAPSMWEEGYGRIAAEAQISGIPVVASARGGLPESVGPGGILLDPMGPIENWVNAIRKLWLDDEFYAKLSEAALAHAHRRDNSVPYKIDLWKQTISAASRVKKDPM